MSRADAKLMQIFLTPETSELPAVFEVSMDKKEKLYCNCPGGLAKGECKHTKYVQGRKDENNGSYPLEVSKKATQAEADAALLSIEKFREYIIKYGKVEVY